MLDLVKDSQDSRGHQDRDSLFRLPMASLNSSSRRGHLALMSMRALDPLCLASPECDPITCPLAVLVLLCNQVKVAQDHLSMAPLTHTHTNSNQESDLTLDLHQQPDLQWVLVPPCL